MTPYAKMKRGLSGLSVLWAFFKVFAAALGAALGKNAKAARS
jgi:hypothetical protein